jgi:TRAP transporter TAXI family solute receptor
MSQGAETDEEGISMKSITRAAVCVAALCIAAAAAAQEKVAITIATGPTGGVYALLGGGMANILSKYVPGYAVNAESTAGAVANLQLMKQQPSVMAFSTADIALEGFTGQGKFSGGAVPVRTLMVAYPNRMHVVTVEGTGINTFADLKGKRVSTGPTNSATEQIAFRVLEAMGLHPEQDIQREPLEPVKAGAALKDRKLDAYFWVGGIPTPGIADLGATPGIKLKLIDHADAVDAMNQKYGQLYARDTIPAQSYPGQDRPTQVAMVWNLIVARADMPNQMAYTIVKMILDKRDELIQVHKEAQNFDLEHQTKAASPIPYHPGAVQYFGERGIKLN